MSNKKYVTYEEFGAKGDGVTDDFLAMRAAHAYANETGLSVKANDDATYYIHDTRVNGKVEQIVIKTDTEWGNCNIVIDDRDLDYYESESVRQMCVTQVFCVASDYEPITLSDENPDDVERLKAIGKIGEKFGTTKLELGLGYPAMVVVYNKNHRVYCRYGRSYSRGGAFQCELLLLDKEGNIDPTTQFLFDYEEVTKVIIHRTDIKPITITGGTVTTRACRVNASVMINVDGEMKKRDAGYYARGLLVNRSYTTVIGLKHYVTDEITPDEHRTLDIKTPPYSGFFYGASATHIIFKDCILTGRRYYLIQGTYDFGANMVNKIVLDGCVQHNFWIDKDGNPSDAEHGESSMRLNDINGKMIRHCWGIGGTNFCKNMEYINSTLSRFDAHCGLYNGKVIGCTVNFLAITGKGDFTLADTKCYSIDKGVVNNSLIYMRDDYGSPWNGKVTIKNVDAYVADDTFWLFFHSYANWDFGYKCYIPELEMENFRVANRGEGFVVRYITDSVLKEPNMHLPETLNIHPMRDAVAFVPDETSHENLNIVGMPKKISIKGNTGKLKFYIHDVPCFENTVIEADEGTVIRTLE